MTRIGDMPTRPGPLSRTSLWFARRKLARLAGRETERMVEPLQAFAHVPRLLLGYGAFELACEKVNRVEHGLKELAVLKAATVVNCEYCIDIGSAVARRSGCSDEQLLALASHRESELFSELEKLVLNYAAAISRTPAAASADLVAALREHFDDRQLVELTNAIALENMRARFNAALGIGSAGFSEGMVCAVAQIERDPQASPLAVAG
jgi:AhpD family alkylhydroperoxidase